MQIAKYPPTHVNWRSATIKIPMHLEELHVTQLGHSCGPYNKPFITEIHTNMMGLYFSKGSLRQPKHDYIYVIFSNASCNHLLNSTTGKSIFTKERTMNNYWKFFYILYFTHMYFSNQLYTFQTRSKISVFQPTIFQLRKVLPPKTMQMHINAHADSTPIEISSRFRNYPKRSVLVKVTALNIATTRLCTRVVHPYGETDS